MQIDITKCKLLIKTSFFSRNIFSKDRDMPIFELHRQPRFPLRLIDTDTPITIDQFHELLRHDTEIMLCVRSATGHPHRGGYFFCIKYNNVTNQYELETVEGIRVANFTENNIVIFINHVAGLQFNNDMLSFCQNNINFRRDDE